MKPKRYRRRCIAVGRHLGIASTKILQSDKESVNDSPNDIDVWVAGGERIYKEALQHDNVIDVQLTHIDMSVGKRVAEEASTIAHFPFDTFESCGYKEVSRSTDGICTFCLYRRPSYKHMDEYTKRNEDANSVRT